MEIFVQPCNYRCYSDDEYRYHGIEIKEDLGDCDILLGIKEVNISYLIPGKTYFIFSHTVKRQPHNRKLLQEILSKKVRLIDWELLTDERHKRLIAFGRWAGIVGAYHALRMIGLKYHTFSIKQMSECHNFAGAQREFSKLKLPPLKLVLTGTGRVSNGAAFLLDLVHIKKVSPYNFCYNEFDEIVYTQLGSGDMYHREGAEKFDRDDYHAHPELYKSNFYPFTRSADVMLNGIYWDKRIPVFFTKEQMKEKDFRIRIISDITCDIAPNSSIPSTVMASSIEEPYYGYDAQNEKLIRPFTDDSIDVMAVDNLPNELPRDASEDFGNMLMSRVLPELKNENSKILYRATIAMNGRLNQPYEYLADYVSVK